MVALVPTLALALTLALAVPEPGRVRSGDLCKALSAPWPLPGSTPRPAAPLVGARWKSPAPFWGVERVRVAGRKRLMGRG